MKWAAVSVAVGGLLGVLFLFPTDSNSPHLTRIELPQQTVEPEEIPDTKAEVEFRRVRPQLPPDPSSPQFAPVTIDLMEIAEAMGRGEDPAPYFEEILENGGEVGDELVAMALQGDLDSTESYVLDLILKFALKASLLDLPDAPVLFADRQVALLLLADAWLENPELYSIAGSVLGEVGILTVSDVPTLVGLFGRSGGIDEGGRQRLKALLRASLAENPQLGREISSRWLDSTDPVLRHLALEGVVGGNPGDPQPILEALKRAPEEELGDLVGIACAGLSVDQAPRVLQEVASQVDHRWGIDGAISVLIERAPEVDPTDWVYLGGDGDDSAGYRRAVLRSFSGIAPAGDGLPQWFDTVLDISRTDRSSKVRRTALLQIAACWPVDDVAGFIAEVRQLGEEGGSRWALLSFENRLGAEAEGTLAPGMKALLDEEIRRRGIR